MTAQRGDFERNASATARAIKFAAVGWLAAVGITLRWLNNAIDEAVRIGGRDW